EPDRTRGRKAGAAARTGLSMYLDALTLLVAGGFVAAMAAFVTATSWIERRSTPALLLWAAGPAVNAICAGALAIALVTSSAAAVVVGSAGIAGSMILYWAGTRVFLKRTPMPTLMIGAVGVWVVTTIPAIYGYPRTSIGASFFLAALMLGAAAIEFA